MQPDAHRTTSNKPDPKQSLGAAKAIPARPRRIVASIKRIEQIIAAAQRRGLSVTKVVQHPDGTCEVHFGAANLVVPHKPKGWGIGQPK